MGHPINDVDNGEPVPFDAPLAARICWYYFKKRQTQDAIARRLGLTRKRVNRILNDARETEFVQVTIRARLARASNWKIGSSDVLGYGRLWWSRRLLQAPTFARSWRRPPAGTFPTSCRRRIVWASPGAAPFVRRPRI
jgi:hypothetical protein